MLNISNVQMKKQEEVKQQISSKENKGIKSSENNIKTQKAVVSAKKDIRHSNLQDIVKNHKVDASLHRSAVALVNRTASPNRVTLLVDTKSNNTEKVNGPINDTNVVKPTDKQDVKQTDKKDIKPTDKQDVKQTDKKDSKPVDKKDAKPTDNKPSKPVDKKDVKPTNKPTDKKDVKPTDKQDINKKPTDKQDSKPTDKQDINKKSVDKQDTNKQPTKPVDKINHDKSTSNPIGDLGLPDSVIKELEGAHAKVVSIPGYVTKKIGIDEKVPVGYIPVSKNGKELTIESKQGTIIVSVPKGIKVPTVWKSLGNDKYQVTFNNPIKPLVINNEKEDTKTGKSTITVKIVENGIKTISSRVYTGKTGTAVDIPYPNVKGFTISGITINGKPATSLPTKFNGNETVIIGIANKRGTDSIVVEGQNGKVISTTNATGYMGQEVPLSVIPIPKGDKILSITENGKPVSKLIFGDKTNKVVIKVKQSNMSTVTVEFENEKGHLLRQDVVDTGKIGSKLSLLDELLPPGYEVTKILVNGKSVNEVPTVFPKTNDKIVIIMKPLWNTSKPNSKPQKPTKPAPEGSVNPKTTGTKQEQKPHQITTSEPVPTQPQTTKPNTVKPKIINKKLLTGPGPVVVNHSTPTYTPQDNPYMGSRQIIPTGNVTSTPESQPTQRVIREQLPTGGAVPTYNGGQGQTMSQATLPHTGLSKGQIEERELGSYGAEAGEVGVLGMVGLTLLGLLKRKRY